MATYVNYASQSLDQLRSQLLAQSFINAKPKIITTTATATTDKTSTSNNNNSNNIIFSLLDIEIMRRDQIAKLASGMREIVQKYSNINNTPTVLNKQISQLLPTWFVTFNNNEWKRNDKTTTVISNTTNTGDNKKPTTTVTMSMRDWICPLMDAGKTVIDVETKKEYIVADQLPTTDDRVNVIPVIKMNTDDCGSQQQQRQQLPLSSSSLKLKTPVPFCRDILIPALEDEPAARCGSAALYSKFRFEFGIQNEQQINKAMREVGELANTLRLELLERYHNNNDENSKRQYSIQAQFLPNSNQDVVEIRYSWNNNNGNSVATCCWTIGTFHFVKLFIMFCKTHNINCIDDLFNNDNNISSVTQMAHNIINHQRQNFNQKNGSASSSDGIIIYHHQRFLASLARCIQRYQNFDGEEGALGNLHAAIHPAFALSLRADVEVFANPFNTSCLHFCSLFGDESASVIVSQIELEAKAASSHCCCCLVSTDSWFGSLGSCWYFFDQIVPRQQQQQQQHQLRIEANPPFDASVVRRLQRSLSAAILSSAKIGGFSCTIIIPEPRTDVKFDSKYATSVAELRSSELCGCVHSAIIPASEAAYVRGQQQQQGSTMANPLTSSPFVLLDCITIQRNTAIIVCATKSSVGGDEDDIKIIVDAAIQQWKDASIKVREDNKVRRQRE